MEGSVAQSEGTRFSAIVITSGSDAARVSTVDTRVSRVELEKTTITLNGVMYPPSTSTKYASYLPGVK